MRRVLILISLCIHSHSWAAGSDVDCADAKPENAASISIGFDYEGTSRDIPGFPALQNTGQDAAFYSTLNKFSNSPAAFYRDREIRNGGSKKQLLKSLVSDVGSARYVNVNFSGHGAVMPNGEWGILLPNVPKKFIDECIGEVDVGKGIRLRDTKNPDFSKNCADFKDYFLTGSDLQQALPGRKFFAAIDTCNAGAANFGPESVALASALSGQVASDGSGKNGAFTEKLDGLFNDCNNDRNQNNHLDLNEMLEHFIPITGVRIDTPRNLRGSAGKITQIPNGGKFQNPGLVIRKELPWTKCFQLRHMPGNCKFHDLEDSGDQPTGTGR